MDTLTGYIATACGSVIATYLSQFLAAKPKVRFWVSHDFLYTLPASPQQVPLVNQLALPHASPQAFQVLTRSVTVQNFGRKAVEWVEIVHRQRPDFFQFYPSLNYTESSTPAGEHVLRINSLAPKEVFTLQLLCYVQSPQLLYIKTNAGHASLIPWMMVRRYPQWVYHTLRILMVIGGGVCVYWLIKFVALVIRLAHTPGIS